ALSELDDLKSVGIHNVDGAARIYKNSANFKVGHVCPDEERNVRIGRPSGELLEIECKRQGFALCLVE
ncbi:hypothetical protein A2U01_0103906, partial [Trifolium medium]|nr:hypothetical protein [Trifolium medium]